MEENRNLWIKDCIRGSLMAGAAGDALGYPVEFMSRKSILAHYGDKGITHFELDSKGKALISDDTQMTLFTANGMLMGLTRGYMRGIGGRPEQYVDVAYLDWYHTQTGLQNKNAFKHTWLRDLPELAYRRAPGTTCMSACDNILQGRKPENNSKGCGGIMRVAPIGLFNAAHNIYGNLELADAGAHIARVTHLHPLGYLPAALMAMLVSHLVPLTPDEVTASMDRIVLDALETMMKIEGDRHLKEKKYLEQLTTKAVKLAMNGKADADSIRQLGEGWTGEEAWAISLYCAMRHLDSTGEAVIAAVNHDGDSDSTGSITGNIMGAIYGYEAIKRERLFCTIGKEFESTIELGDIILALSDDLFSGCIISEYDPIDTPAKQQWFERYCEMMPAGIR